MKSSSLMSQTIKSINHLFNKIIINGKLCNTIDGKTFDTINPAINQKISSAASANLKDVEIASINSYEAFKKWKDVNATTRAEILIKCAELLEKHQEEIAMLLSIETGKAIRTESKIEVANYTKTFRYYAGLALEMKGNTTPLSEDMICMTLREPIGVIGAIVPWNVPLLLMSLKIAPAIIAGNTVILKSPDEAPFTILRVAELMNQILPPGILNVLSGDGAICGEAIITDPRVKKITFTGSDITGRLVYTNGAKKLIPVTLELGGKSPMIICNDIDINQTIIGAINSMRFTRQGQSCTAASRIFVHYSRIDEFVEKLKYSLDKLIIGDPLDETTDIGSIVSRKHYDNITNYINIGINTNNAKLHRCSNLPNDQYLKDGYYLQPHIFTGLSNSHNLCQEEIFGPVTAIIPWNSFDEAIEMANDTKYGLSATIWTENLQYAMNGIKKLEAGIIQVNQNLVVQPGISFGGYKSSGIGKEGSLEAMLENFTKSKTVIIKIN